MKKLFKSSLVLATGALLLTSTGCSCSMKQGKIDERTEALSNSDILSVGGQSTDFSATYRITTTKNGTDVSTNTIIVSRDIDTQTYYFSHTYGNGKVDEELNTVTETQKAYLKDGRVYVKNTTNENGAETPTSYANTYYLYQASEYFEYISNTYENYKTVPFNACSTDTAPKWEKRSKVYQLAPTYGDKVTCKAKKKLFGKEYTYEISYRVSLSQTRKLTMKVNKDDKITYLKVEDTIAVSGNKVPTSQVVEYSVSYDDVK